MTARGQLVFLLISFTVVTPLAAQQTMEQRVQQLEKRLDDLSRHDIYENLGEQPALRIPFEVVGRLVPAEVRI